MNYLPACSPEALPERPGPDPGLQSAEHKGRFVRSSYLLTDKLISGLVQYLVPGHRFRPEERACEFYGQTFLVVLGFVLRHTE